MEYLVLVVLVRKASLDFVYDVVEIVWGVHGDGLAESECIVELAGLDGVHEPGVVVPQRDGCNVHEHVQKQVAVQVGYVIAHTLRVFYVELYRACID